MIITGFVPSPSNSNPLAITEYDSAGFQNSTGRTVVSSPIDLSIRTLFWITLGQSLQTNSVNAAYTVTNPTKVLNFNTYDGVCYQYADPVLGCSEPTGSMMGRLGDLLIADNKFDRFISMPISVGGSTINDWTPQGNLGHRLIVA